MPAMILHAEALQLKREKAFVNLAQEEQQRILEPLGESIFVPAGAPLFHQEDKASYLFRVMEGAVRAFTFTEDQSSKRSAETFCWDRFHKC